MFKINAGAGPVAKINALVLLGTYFTETIKLNNDMEIISWVTVCI